MTTNDAVGSDGAVLLLCSCVRCGAAPAAPASVPVGQGRGFHLEKIHLVFVLCKETVGFFLEPFGAGPRLFHCLKYKGCAFSFVSIGR